MKYIVVGTNVVKGTLAALYNDDGSIKAFDSWVDAASAGSDELDGGLVNDISIFDVETGGC